MELAMATARSGWSDPRRRYMALDLSLLFVLSCTSMCPPRPRKLRSPCCAHNKERDWDLAPLELQTFWSMRSSRAQAGKPHTTCAQGLGTGELAFDSEGCKNSYYFDPTSTHSEKAPQFRLSCHMRSCIPCAGHSGAATAARKKPRHPTAAHTWELSSEKKNGHTRPLTST